MCVCVSFFFCDQKKIVRVFFVHFVAAQNSKSNVFLYFVIIITTTTTTTMAPHQPATPQSATKSSSSSSEQPIALTLGVLGVGGIGKEFLFQLTGSHVLKAKSPSRSSQTPEKKSDLRRRSFRPNTTESCWKRCSMARTI